MDEILKLLSQATSLIEKLNTIIIQHDVEINELRNQIKELQEHGNSTY